MTGPLRVLYVDDEQDLLDLGREFLEAGGEFIFDTCISARVALDQLSTKQYDAIVSDYKMPDMDGIQFLVEVRERYGPVPFIIFTGKGREEIAVEAFENGADFYLLKGGDPKLQFAELSIRIRKAVDHRRADMQVATLNRLYSMLSASNKAIMRIQNKKELLDEICRIAVDIGGFRMAWAGFVYAQKHFIKPIAAYGYIDGYLDSIAISTDDIFMGRGPTGTAFREKTFNICNDVANDVKMVPWREEALMRGYHSIAAFPFALNTKNPSVITFYAPEPDFFTEPIIRFLDEQSTDLSIAFVTIDHEDQRKAAEHDLKISELRYRHLFETAQEAILILDGDTGEVIDANKFILNLLGYPPEYFIGKHLWELEFIRDKSIALNAFTELKTKGNVQCEDIPLVTKDGLMMDGEFIGNAYFVDNKKIIQCNIRDITKRKRVEKELKQIEERFSGIFDAINDGIHIHEIELDGTPGKFIAVNEAACRMLGYPREEMLKHGPFDFVTGYHSRPVEDIVAELFSTGQAVFETEHRRKDGTTVLVEINARVVNFQRERVIVSVVRDITGRKQAELALALANRKLNLLSSITRHDILNQLRVLIGQLELMNRKQPDPSFNKYFDKIFSAAERIQVMIQFTKTYESIGVKAPVWQDCRSLVDKAAKEATLGDVVVKNDLPVATEIFADPLIVKAFYNLMDNAVKYGEKITTIRFFAEKHRDKIVIFCEDDGASIPADKKEKIFERGFVKNTGHGLFLSREILSITGMTIAETGEAEKGARFEITVPKGVYR